MTTPKEYAQSLRKLAGWYEQQKDDLELPGLDMTVYPDESKEAARAWAKALGSFNKSGDDTFFRLVKDFGCIQLRVTFWRRAVCERRVVGKKKVKVKKRPYIEPIVVEEEQDIVEWDCQAILSEAEQVLNDENSDKKADKKADNIVPF